MDESDNDLVNLLLVFQSLNSKLCTFNLAAINNKKFSLDQLLINKYDLVN